MPEHNDGIVSKYINRRFSNPLTKLILRLFPKCNPNHISIVSAVIGFIGGISFWMQLPLLGGIFVQISSIVDGSDGEVARLTNSKTFFGGFFDSVLDRYVDIIVFLGMMFYSIRFISFEIVLFLGLFALSGAYLVSYTSAKIENKEGISFSRTIQGRDTRLFLIFLAGIVATFNQWAIPICLFLIGAITHLSVFIRLRQVYNSI
ncbi:MAG: CDP-alcohol phosphatidyltransferase family protein [Candidatus Hodarchaeales archaeon]